MKNLLSLSLVLGFILISTTAYSQTVERVAFSSVASNNNDFQPNAGAPYGAHLSNANGSLTVSAEYGGGTITGAPNDVHQEAISSIKVYPSPTIDVVHIEMDKPSTVRLYDLKGQLLLTHTTNDLRYSIDMRSLASGQYIISIGDKEQPQNYRIIKN